MKNYQSSFGIFIFWLSCLGCSAYDTDFSLSLAERYMVFAGISYCTNPLVTTDHVSDWSCYPCQTYPNVNATVFHSIDKNGNGYVGYDSDANEILVVFAGTDPLSFQNWLDDLDFFQTSYPYCDDCMVHGGFYKTFNTVVDKVKSLTKSYMQAYPTAKLIIVGHSLGAALAALCAAEFSNGSERFEISKVYTYGMPRVGDKNFANWYKDTTESNIPGTYRVTHNHDPVPHVPLQAMNFYHMPYEAFYIKDYTAYKLCDYSGEDQSCSDQFYLDLNIVDHTFYMGFDLITNYLRCKF